MNKFTLSLLVFFTLTSMMGPTFVSAVTLDDNQSVFQPQTVDLEEFGSIYDNTLTLHDYGLINFGTDKIPIYYKYVIYQSIEYDLSQSSTIIGCLGDTLTFTVSETIGMEDDLMQSTTDSVTDEITKSIGLGFSDFGFSAEADWSESVTTSTSNTLETASVSTDYTTTSKESTIQNQEDYDIRYDVYNVNYLIDYLPTGVDDVDELESQIYLYEKSLEVYQAEYDVAQASWDDALDSSPDILGSIENKESALLDTDEGAGIQVMMISALAQIEETESTIESLEDQLVSMNLQEDDLSAPDEDTDGMDTLDVINDVDAVASFSVSAGFQGYKNLALEKCDIATEGNSKKHNDASYSGGEFGKIYQIQLESELTTVDDFGNTFVSLETGTRLIIHLIDYGGINPHVQVTDDKNHVIAGAVVTIGDDAKLTNMKGIVHFDNLIIHNDGLVKITATHSEYDPGHKLFTINAHIDEIKPNVLKNTFEFICQDKVFVENINGKIACVTSSTATKLVERGWGTLLD